MAITQQTFKNWSVYSAGKKHGNASKASIELMSGNESYVGDDGHLGTSKAKRTAKLSISEYVSIGGRPEQDFLYRAWKTGDYVDMACGVVGGKVLQFTGMSVMSIKMETDMAKGTSTMDIELEGPPPDDVG